MELKDMLTVKEAAEIADIDTSNIHRAIQKGRLQAERIGGKMYLIRRDWLKAWMDNPAYHRPGPKPED